MNYWNRLLIVLDTMYAHGVKKTSSVKALGQAFDNRTGEQVIRFEYRVKLRLGETSPVRRPGSLLDSLLD